MVSAGFHDVDRRVNQCTCIRDLCITLQRSYHTLWVSYAEASLREIDPAKH